MGKYLEGMMDEVTTPSLTMQLFVCVICATAGSYVVLQQQRMLSVEENRLPLREFSASSL